MKFKLEESKRGLREASDRTKKFLAFDRSNPEEVVLFKGEISGEDDFPESWAAIDVTGEQGNHIVVNNDENIYIIKLDKSVEEIDKEIFEALKKDASDNPDDEYLYVYHDILDEIEVDAYEFKNSPESFAHLLSDRIENSYVDGDSNSQWQVMDLSDSNAADFSEWFQENEDTERSTEVWDQIILPALEYTNPRRARYLSKYDKLIFQNETARMLKKNNLKMGDIIRVIDKQGKKYEGRFAGFGDFETSYDPYQHGFVVYSKYGEILPIYLKGNGTQEFKITTPLKITK